MRSNLKECSGGVVEEGSGGVVEQLADGHPIRQREIVLQQSRLPRHALFQASLHLFFLQRSPRWHTPAPLPVLGFSEVLHRLRPARAAAIRRFRASAWPYLQSGASR